MTIRTAFAIGALAALVAGCTTSYVVVAATGGRVAAASKAGISVAAYPETWRGYPSDLPDYLTPIWVDIVLRSVTGSVASTRRTAARSLPPSASGSRVERT